MVESLEIPVPEQQLSRNHKEVMVVEISPEVVNQETESLELVVSPVEEKRQLIQEQGTTTTAAENAAKKGSGMMGWIKNNKKLAIGIGAAGLATAGVAAYSHYKNRQPQQ